MSDNPINPVNISIINQVNVSMDDATKEMLEKMMVEDSFDNRSAFVRLLIRREYKRRQIFMATVAPEPPPF